MVSHMAKHKKTNDPLAGKTVAQASDTTLLAKAIQNTQAPTYDEHAQASYASRLARLQEALKATQVKAKGAKR